MASGARTTPTSRLPMAMARLFRKSLPLARTRGPGKEARLSFMGHPPMENRTGLVVGAVATRASGACRVAAAVTLGPDKGSDSSNFVIKLREQAVTPRVAQKPAPSALDDGRGTRSRCASANASRTRPTAQIGGREHTMIDDPHRAPCHRPQMPAYSFVNPPPQLAARPVNLKTGPNSPFSAACQSYIILQSPRGLRQD